MPTLPPKLINKARQGQKADTEKVRQKKTSKVYDAAWRKLSKAFLKDKFCADCFANGKVVMAKHSHHMIEVADDPSRRLDVTNLRPLCHACHSKHHAKKRHEDGGWSDN